MKVWDYLIVRLLDVYMWVLEGGAGWVGEREEAEEKVEAEMELSYLRCLAPHHRQPFNSPGQSRRVSLSTSQSAHLPTTLQLPSTIIHLYNLPSFIPSFYYTHLPSFLPSIYSSCLPPFLFSFLHAYRLPAHHCQLAKSLLPRLNTCLLFFLPSFVYSTYLPSIYPSYIP